MKQCPICGKDVPPRAGKRDSVYCSRACLQAHYAEAWETLTCPVCGNVFRAQKLWRRQYCSAECANRAQRGRKITSAAFLEACRHRGVWGPRKHPRTGKFETNCHAKVWRVESPEGEEVTARNLKLYMVTPPVPILFSNSSILLRLLRWSQRALPAAVVLRASASYGPLPASIPSLWPSVPRG